MSTLSNIEPELQRIPPQSEGLVPPDSSPMNLLSLALRNNAAIDVIERLAALQREQRDYLAQVEFDNALNRCQERLRQVVADASNSQTNSRYATYAKLDRAVRPIYTAEQFSVSFGEKDCPTPGKTRFVAYLSRSGVTREFIKDISPSTKGPKGSDVMTPIHADASADSYAKRYLLKNIFNIAIGEDDNDGNGGTRGVPVERFRKNCDAMYKAKDLAELKRVWESAYREAIELKDGNALKGYKQAKNARKSQLGGQP